jgi:hypothetical protein
MPKSRNKQAHTPIEVFIYSNRLFRFRHPAAGFGQEFFDAHTPARFTGRVMVDMRAPTPGFKNCG